ncbi:MAG: cysteine synthase A, partial [Asticcacaulis sp.]|nr:cysteine synthase A [Asticcacaulis sp.]
MADNPSTNATAARFSRAGRGKIFDSILDTMGDTPLVRL